MSGVLASLNVHADMMRSALTADMLATDVADYLVKKGVPFRQTHHIAGAIVRAAEEQKVSIPELQLPQLQAISPLFEEDIRDVFDFERSVEKRTSIGGTCKASVLEQVAAIEQFLTQRK